MITSRLLDTLIARLKDEARTWPVSPLEHLLTEAAAALIALHQNRDECAAVFEMDRQHELIGPVPECACSSCNLHHRYEAALASLQQHYQRLMRVVGDAVSFLDTVEWTTRATEEEAEDLANAIQEAIEKAERSSLQTSAPPAPEPQGWHPIATAPKSGEVLHPGDF